MNEKDVKEVIQSDPWMMDVLQTARSLHLPDWMIGAGFVRNKIWDYLHEIKNEKVQTPDIDLVYFDPNGNSKKEDEKLSQQMSNRTGIDWEIVNQIYTHDWHNRPPYKNTEEALGEWVETPTAVAIRLEDDDSLTLIAPHGIGDLVGLIVRPTPTHLGQLNLFWERVKSKKWEERWPKLTVLES